MQVQVVLAVVPGPMEPHPELLLALVWMVLFQEVGTNLLHVTEKLEVRRRAAIVTLVIFREAQLREVLDVPLWNALIVRCGYVLDVAEDHVVILVHQATLLLSSSLLSHISMNYATEKAAPFQASHFDPLIVFIELSGLVLVSLRISYFLFDLILCFYY